MSVRTVSDSRAHSPRESPADSPLTLEDWHSDGLLISGPLPSRWKLSSGVALSLEQPLLTCRRQRLPLRRQGELCPSIRLLLISPQDFPLLSGGSRWGSSNKVCYDRKLASGAQCPQLAVCAEPWPVIPSNTFLPLSGTSATLFLSLLIGISL